MKPPHFSTVILAVFVSSSLYAAPSPSPASDPAYVEVTNARADKIVAPLGLADADQRQRVRDVIAQQYRDLAALDAELAGYADSAAATTGDAAAAPSRRERAADLHYAFLGRLAAELTPAQVDAVKDGMTYGVRPLTYQVYQDMVPTLTAEQQRQILAWLTEAREHALDAGSSEEKHARFGRYKGRINNYLAAAGIDLKQAERDLRARRAAANSR